MTKTISQIKFDLFGNFIDLWDQEAAVEIRGDGILLLDEGKGDDRIHGFAARATRFTAYPESSVDGKVKYGRLLVTLVGPGKKLSEHELGIYPRYEILKKLAKLLTEIVCQEEQSRVTMQLLQEAASQEFDSSLEVELISAGSLSLVSVETARTG